MSDLIYVESNELEQDALVEMFELDLSKRGLGTFRFTPSSAQPVHFDGFEFVPAPIEASGFQWDGVGTMPRPTLRLAAKDLYFLNLVFDADDLIGSPVRRFKTYRKFLDDGSQGNRGLKFPTEHFVIERKNTQTRHLLEFELSTKLDQEGMQLPRKVVLRDTCVHNYRYWDGERLSYKQVSCPYAGDTYFEANGDRTYDQKKDACGKRISDCKKRFGENAVLPRLAFPGVGRY